ncbi:hypothetical protein KSF_106110 [Reticulibacter mediterranei]|uniref:Uncharacterized protein n=1 Tax=Reticulibacter mediterranei TaxID=2778369 RepID=A0A8J3IU02_9CHLR|nr:hypothetical protein KSF_106110 [Reticulibacter mediterranei]
MSLAQLGFPLVNEERLFLPECSPNLQNSDERSQVESGFPLSPWPIPLFHADFPGFTRKIGEHSRSLLRAWSWSTFME